MAHGILGNRLFQYFVFGAAALLAVVWAAGRLVGPQTLTPDELAERALGAATVDEQEEAAIDLARCGKDAAEQMRRVFGQSTVPEVRAAVAQGLGYILDVDSLSALIDALEDPSVLVRGRAGVAVGRIVGDDGGFRADAPLKERQEAVAKYREFWQRAQSPQSHFIEYMKDPEKARARAEAIVAEMRKNQRTGEEKTNAPK